MSSLTKILTLLTLLTTNLLLAEMGVQPQYYSENKGQLTLQNIKTQVSYEVSLKGKSGFDTLMAQVTRLGKPTRKYELEKARGEINWTLPARDGKGPYQVTLFGLMPDGRTYKGMASFKFSALQDYPKELINEAEERMSYYSAAKSGFRLETPPLTTDKPLVFKGINKFNTVMIQIQKAGGSARQMRFQYKGNTNFSWIYQPKDGSGKYSITFFGNQDGGVNYTALVTYTQEVTVSPITNRLYSELNKNILSFAQSSSNKTIGRGECWDLAAQALDLYQADWARPFFFGRPFNPKTEQVFPGDILQMYSLKLVTRLPNGSVRTEYFGLPQHTAVVEKVIASNTYLMLNQNVAGKRYVVRTVLDLNKLVSGKIDFYRPQPGLLKGD